MANNNCNIQNPNNINIDNTSDNRNIDNRVNNINTDNRHVDNRHVDNRHVDNRSVDNRSIAINNSINNSNNRSNTCKVTVINVGGILAGPIIGFGQPGNNFWPPHQPPPQNPPPARPAVPGNNPNRPPAPPAVPAPNPLPAPIVPSINNPPPPPPAPVPPPAQAPPRPFQLRVLHFQIGPIGEILCEGEFPFLVRPGLTWMDLAMPCAHARGVPANELAGGTWLFVQVHSDGLKTSQVLDWEGPVNGLPDNAGQLEQLLFDVANFSAAVQKSSISQQGYLAVNAHYAERLGSRSTELKQTLVALQPVLDRHNAAHLSKVVLAILQEFGFNKDI
ncbi:hypothetical protein FN846DRAFT_901829 [Sphaerosporella brunnea]|uniref:Uncharacterized protein n=1 Tax=Sphaerosporella brunnea TaxID=1250544 RepID=A0A5J5FAX2_9PEZI|nr:hypothetical protein FN846DRAFT_901829 [Sphaerosporella brunnea]